MATMLEKKMRIISAGAGSGKTHRLTEELCALLSDPGSDIRPEGIVATTFTRKAAAELVERVRQSLFKNKRGLEAERISAGFIGTINSICGSLLKQVAFEAGVSPQLEVIAEDDQQVLFNQALEEVVIDERVTILEEIGERFGGIDWKDALKDIVDAARSNDCQLSDLGGFAKKSITGLMTFIPQKSKQTADALDKALARAVVTAVRNIRDNVSDGTKGTNTYLEELEGFASRLNGRLLPWTDWVWLATKGPTKASAPLAEPVQQAAAKHAIHPRFHDDLATYITTLFELAASVIEHFQSYKRERGLMDFVDQESEFMAALDLPEVRERLQEELDLLLVDEFQDTSPIQLALFLRLTALVKKSVWVGDPKQSIYAFRGADPALMAAVVKAVPIKPGDVQAKSYRSRPDLVRFANGLFVPGFYGMLPREQVELAPDRGDTAGAASALRIWPLDSGNKEGRMEVIADGIAGLIDEAPVVIDKASGKDRKAQGGDIAVLCRSHDVCREIAKALASRGVPVAIGRPGLLDTPEGKLVIACLRYFQNDHDTLANAEIQVLTSADPKPEEWLADRFKWLTTEGNRSHEWGVGHKVLAALKDLSSRSIDFSPSEALDEIIESIDLRRLLLGWGEQERRLGNLENLRQMVRTYEENCKRQMSAATVSGFLLWLSELSGIEKDSQAEGYGAHAVSILTCHAAKGLEWPIVVAATLDTKPRERVWGVTVVDDRKNISLSDPLAGRWIRFWPWPYGKKSKDTGLLENMQGSPVLAKAAAGAEAEELRLLYVTLTRARDYQVLCVKGKGNPWLDHALTKAKLALPSLKEEQIVAVDWEGKGRKVKFQIQFPKAAVDKIAETVSAKWVVDRTGPVSYPPAKVNPSAMELAADATVFVGQPIVTGKMLKLVGEPSYQYLGLALHNFIAVDHAGKNALEKRISLLQGLLARHGVSGAVVPADMLGNCDGFYSFIAGLKPIRILTEWPMQMKIGEQLMVGTADMLFDTPEGWIVVDHKSYAGPPSSWAKEAEGYAGQLKAYSEALKLATGRPVVGAYINFVVGGGVVGLKIQ